MRGKLGDKARLRHILDAILELETYLVGVNMDSFLGNSMMRFACIKQMEIIGEASNHLTDEMKTQLSNIEWAQIIGMRNIFVHEYFGIDPELVWDILKNDLPDLKNKIKMLVDSIE
jgi:uncharacterized protein with HEPN domain